MDYTEAVQEVGQLAEKFQETIREQDSDAYQKLDGLWEMNVKENAEELVNRLCQEENEAGRAAVEAEVEAERLRRERNIRWSRPRIRRL